MSSILFAKPIDKKRVQKPTWKGIPRVSFTRPAVARTIDPIVPEQKCEKQVNTRSSLSAGTIAIILDGEHKGRRGVVINDQGAGILTIAGVDFPASKISQDYLIATETKLDLGKVESANAEAAIQTAAGKIPEMLEYLKVPFTLKKGDRPHLMRF